MAERLVHRHSQGRFASLVVVAEGATPVAGTLVTQAQGTDAFGHPCLGGIASLVGLEIERRTGFETRVTILGHVQRGGTPTAFDRVLATRFGIAAIDAFHDRAWGHMVAFRDGEIIRVPLQEAVGTRKTVDLALYRDVAGAEA